MKQLNDEEEGEKTSVAHQLKLMRVWMSFGYFSFLIWWLLGNRKRNSRPMFHAFNGSFPFPFFVLFFHHNGCIPSVEFLFFCLHFFAIPIVVVRSWEGRATCMAFFGTTEQGLCVEGDFFWVYRCGASM